MHSPDQSVPDRWTVRPDVAYTKLDDEEAVLLDLETKQYYSINETGVLIWELLQEQNSLADIAASLSQTYGLGREKALGCVHRFVEELRRDDLVRARPNA